MTDKYKIYGDSLSGNCYKIELACAELDIDYDWQEVNILDGETRTPEFMAMNPNGRIPLLVLPDGRYLPESNAILWYLSEGSALNGADSFGRAQILQWLFFEQYSHEPYIATSRFIVRYLGSPPERQASLEEKRPGGYMALDVMEGRLGQSDFIARDTYSIADIALYAYTHVAEEGGFELDNYPAIRSWLERVAAREKFVPMRKKE